MSSLQRRLGLVIGVVLLVQGGLAGAQVQVGELRIPPFQGTSFADQPVKLPEDLRGKIAVLVVGFTHGSQNAVGGWGKRLAADYRDSPGVVYYEMPVLAGAPRIMLGMIVGKIKGSLPDPVKPHFVPILENQAGWQAVANYKSGDDAYVIVVDGQGVVRWQTHEAVSDAAYAQLRQQVDGARTGVTHPAQ
jgi:hypothetical protein